MSFNIYLSGEIHTDWRQKIIQGCEGTESTFSSAITDHDSSDAAGDLLDIKRMDFGVTTSLQK